MQAAYYSRTGPASQVLELGTLPDPEPGPGEVLVRVRASGINPADVKRRAGWNGMTMQHPLVVPHTDGAGEIVAVGQGVDASRVGERVWLWNAQGGYGSAGRAFGTAAERIAIAAEQAVPLADALGFDAGACLGVPAMTAFRAVFADGPVEGMTVLVNGAAGAVGHFAVQLAVAGGARVVGTVSSEAAAAHARAAGAHHVIDRKRQDLVAETLALTDGGGVDRIVEVDFAANLERDVAMLRENGTIASYSSSSDPRPTLPYYAFANRAANLRFIQGFSIPRHHRREGEAMLFRLAGEGRLTVAIGATHPLSEIAAAHERVEGGGLGNVVLLIP